MGKSIPVATGVLPAIAAVVGGRRGIRKAGARLNKPFRYQKDQAPIAPVKYAHDLQQNYDKLKRDENVSAGQVKDAYRAWRNVQDANERQALKQVLAGSSTYMGGTALAGMALESMRRAAKGEAPVEE